MLWGKSLHKCPAGSAPGFRLHGNRHLRWPVWELLEDRVQASSLAGTRSCLADLGTAWGARGPENEPRKSGWSEAPGDRGAARREGAKSGSKSQVWHSERRLIGPFINTYLVCTSKKRRESRAVFALSWALVLWSVSC